MTDSAARGGGTGESVDRQPLAPEGLFVGSEGEGRPPVTDGPFAETKDLIAGWMVIDVDSHERAVELAGQLSAPPGAGRKPIHQWLQLPPVLGPSHTLTEGRPSGAPRAPAFCRPARRPQCRCSP